MGDPNPEEFLKMCEARSAALDEQLKEYIEQWRQQRQTEEDELSELKEKQAKRKEIREEEDKKEAEKKKAEQEKKFKEAEEKRLKDAEEKRKRLEEAEKKRQAMLQARKEQQQSRKAVFSVGKKEVEGMDLAIERLKTKEQLEEEKRISLGVRIKPLVVDNLEIERLRLKAMELWDNIILLETEKYDLEEKSQRQMYDLKELRERQRQQLRHKALKKGLDPEALTGRYPPKIQVASKYERRVDTRSYDDKKRLFEGGWITTMAEDKEKMWKWRAEMFAKRRKRKLPRWMGERPGKKPDAPESPEEEEVAPEEEHEDFILMLSDSEDEKKKGEEEEEEEEEDEEEEDEDEEEEEEEEEEE